MERAYHGAEKYWKRTPELCVSITKYRHIGLWNDEGTATIPDEPNTACEITIRAGLRFCDLQEVMDHEYGHLLGLEHNTIPNNIMNPYNGPDFCYRQENQNYRRKHHA